MCYISRIVFGIHRDMFRRENASLQSVQILRISNRRSPTDMSEFAQVYKLCRCQVAMQNMEKRDEIAV